jgi:hypothetical protein
MTTLEQMKAKADTMCNASMCVRIQDVYALIEATYNARTQEVVEIAGDTESDNYALMRMIKALSPEVKDDTDLSERDPDYR